MEKYGYSAASKMVPDISLGKTFSDYLSKKGYQVDKYPRYMHQYDDGREVDARAYHNEVLSDLRRFFVEDWLKNRATAYFSERDPDALPYLNQILALPNYKEALGYIDVN